MSPKSLRVVEGKDRSVRAPTFSPSASDHVSTLISSTVQRSPRPHSRPPVV